MGTPSSTPSSALSRDISLSSYSTTFQESGFHKIKEERAKWGSLYDPFSKDSGRNSRSGPVWLEKGLNDIRDSEEESVRSAFSYIRGQNVPIDPGVLAERESRRRKAMELQAAIKEQLLERENIRRREKEKRLFEERLEEERIMRQMEAERERLDYEQKIQQEKNDLERKKQEVMRMALEKAEQDAKLEREKKKREKVMYSSIQHSSNMGLEGELDETIRVEKIGGLTTEIHVEGCTSAANLNEEEIKKTSDYGDFNRFEEETEKILIGTPIKLRQKTSDNVRHIKSKLKKMEKHQEVDEEKSDYSNSNNSNHTEIPNTASAASAAAFAQNLKQHNQEATDIDGIALVLQTISPIVPLPVMSQKDFFGLKNINANFQFATLMMTQQSPGVASPASATSGGIPTGNTGTYSVTTTNGAMPAPANASTTVQFNALPLVPMYSGQVLSDLNQSEVKHDDLNNNNDNINKSSRLNESSEDRQCILCKKNHYLRSKMTEIKATDNFEEEKLDDTIEKHFSSNESVKSFESATQPHQEQPSQQSQRLLSPRTLDASTSTKDDELINRILELKILTPQKYRSIDSNLNMINTQEVSTQTDSEAIEDSDDKSLSSSQLFGCDYCRHHYYHHHHINLKEITETLTNLQSDGSLELTEKGHRIIDTISNNNKNNLNNSTNLAIKNNNTHNDDDDEDNQQETMMTTTTTTTTTIRSKSKEKKSMNNNNHYNQQNITATHNQEHQQFKTSSSSSNDRPKWGVNRPLMQYIKASDRDPFYIKNRRKKYIKRSNSEQKYDDCSSSSSLNNNRKNNNTINNAMNTINNNINDKMQKTQQEGRNYCTEILPIKTDKNGKVYLIREASFILNEVYRKKNAGILTNQQQQQEQQQQLNKRFNRRINSEIIDRSERDDNFIDVVVPVDQLSLKNQRNSITLNLMPANTMDLDVIDNNRLQGPQGVNGFDRRSISSAADVDVDNY